MAYSLGNFLTYRGFNLDGPAGAHRCAAARVVGPTDSFAAARFIPMVQRPGSGPAPDPEPRGARAHPLALGRGLRRSTAARFDDDGEILPPE